MEELPPTSDVDQTFFPVKRIGTGPLSKLHPELKSPLGLVVDPKTADDDDLYETSPKYPSIAADEIGFAIAVFVSAANGRKSLRIASSTTPERNSAKNCRKVFAGLSAHCAFPTPPDRPVVSHESSLEAAFLQLWQQYHGDERQASICARVLGFYYIMEQTKGAAVERWMSRCPEHSDVVMLHSEVIRAIAEVPLSQDGHMADSLLIATVESLISQPVSC